jgi:hypothetical protein
MGVCIKQTIFFQHDVIVTIIKFYDAVFFNFIDRHMACYQPFNTIQYNTENFVGGYPGE